MKKDTLKSLKEDILRLQELVVSQGKRISELEQDIRPEPQPPKRCKVCNGTGWKNWNTHDKLITCRPCVGTGYA